MTKVVHPYAHRLGILRDWKSRWFGSRSKYRDFLKSDMLLRRYLAKKLKPFYISSIDMERDEKLLRIVIKTSRPGMLIGKSGEGAVKLKEDVKHFLAKHNLEAPAEVKIDVEEIRSPESDAAIVAHMLSEGLSKRMPWRRLLKQTIEKVSANRDVKGVRVRLAGRLGGSDMARAEELKKGRIPLQTFRADIDFAKDRGFTPQGHIGIKVWIYRGDIFEEDAKKQMKAQNA